MLSSLFTVLSNPCALRCMAMPAHARQQERLNFNQHTGGLQAALHVSDNW
jgi:hypothetical protein